ncbi:Rha family transcriptional regulator [Pseudomonas ogarae]|uniref:Rha family transcriptional regulator n=1 Tax=Pseudomonas ogarae (strain DSM 112162 / CECT 30235 / F113) TaxID=1114970 RepID=UPI001645A286|nr:Rha family transcriptional regulator [Pseudomonas zarinae]QXH96089.1 Rha family transcriptional regulator [Pseudomonas zarinae]
MTITPFSGGDAVTMSSQEIADLVTVRHDSVKRTIERLAEKGAIQLPPLAEVKNHLGQTVSVFQVCKRDSFVVVAQLSPEFTAALVDRWQALEEQASRPMTQAEITAANANHLVAVERQQREQQFALERIETRVANVEQVRYLDSRPAGFESMTSIRERINLRLGLPQWVINAVMRDIPGAPLPFAMVRSKHADDGAQPYAIWPKADITRRFDRFAAECTFVTPERATHPDIQQSRFKLCQRRPA